MQWEGRPDGSVHVVNGCTRTCCSYVKLGWPLMGVDKYVWLLYKRRSKYGLLMLELSSKYWDWSKNALCINSANRTNSGGLVGEVYKTDSCSANTDS